METARHVLDTYFSDTTNPLVRHHLDSYDDLLNVKIPTFIKATNPLRLALGDERTIDVFVGGRDGTDIYYSPPVDELNNAILPHACRLNNQTYSLEIHVNIEIDYFLGKETVTKKFPNIALGKLPLMLKSSLCYLSSMTSEQLFDSGECKFELGGYFVIGGAEKSLLTQERLGNNMFYASKRIQVTSSDSGKRTLVEKEEASKLEDATKGEKYEYVAGVKSISEDGSKGPYSHFLILPPANAKPNDPKELASQNDFSSYSTRRFVTITLPGFTQPVPLISVFYALGLTTDQDIYDTILCGIPQDDRSPYDETFAEIVLSHEKFVAQEMLKESDKNQDPNLLFLRRQSRTRSNGGVYVNLFDELFPHCEIHDNESTASFYRRKAYLLGQMTRMAMELSLNIKPKTDRDHLRFKRLVASGELVFQEFVKIYKQISKRMLTELDTRVHFEAQAYVGKKLADLVQDENIGYYWRSYSFLNDLEKSFKGKWGGKDGISQELSRLAYLGTIAQLRRVNVDMDKGTKIIESRRIHASSWGLLCPSDNPDGGNIGLIKSMTLLCSISTAFPSQTVLTAIKTFPSFHSISTIHPSVWNPIWTKVFLNSDLMGIVEKDTESFHKLLLSKRRSGDFQKYVSLCWNRLENEYIIFCDAGRPCRPLYRENTLAEEVEDLKTWTDISSKHMDYVDAQESESLRISMKPFSNTLSEIHGLTLFSASASVLPNCDFNAAVRNAFSCQQTKQACSWYNTAFHKRFDTISTWLNYAQRPLAQTWAFKHVMGKNGCLAYGENPIVALMIYSGYNQEDSVLLNENALKRGMFHTTVFHSYDIAEEMINVMAQTHNEFGNPATEPRFRETVTRKEGYIYDYLDGDGIIKVGSPVTDKTILVGILVPLFDIVGGVKSYIDKSSEPKRGQTGVVDSVYRYVTPDGLHGVKIRIAEHRLPVLGDKFSARHGQKGTVGLRVLEEDMPFTASGMRPDMIVNPHAFPSRMTIGMFLEMMSTKLGLHMGALVDGTPFSTQNRVGETRDLLAKAGFHQYGNEIMYNGQTGEMLEAEIFTGPTHYLRLKQMVEDKINYRATGPKKLLTHQPVEGRSNDGGLRIGEMERDVLLTHGISKFINESFMDRSDKSEILFQPELGVMDANTEVESTTLTVPYALSLHVHELEAMHISMKLVS